MAPFRVPVTQQILANGLGLLSMVLLVACVQLSRQPNPTTASPTSVGSYSPSMTPSIQSPAQIGSSAFWIEVDLTRQTVVLHEGNRVVAEYLASSGVSSDPRYATPPGLYRVQSMEKGPIESSPGVFVSDVIVFDIYKGNGIHSRPMDANGNVLDTALGQPATAGCVRVGESARVFEFAQLGMWVWIH